MNNSEMDQEILEIAYLIAIETVDAIRPRFKLITELHKNLGDLATAKEYANIAWTRAERYFNEEVKAARQLVTDGEDRELVKLEIPKRWRVYL